MRTIAFYLPQFHPIPENDRWWGKGFTEWTNVTKARPLFNGHFQPRLPADLGFYDLRVPEVRYEQAQLARNHGLYGFCYHYYWFNGRKLLDYPLRKILETGEPDFPFCLCYANENWTRRWDGQDHEILIRQIHDSESDHRFIHDILPILQDHRYIRIDDRPLLLVYRGQLFPDPRKTTETWRREAIKAGIKDLYLCCCQTFGDITNPKDIGFDAAVEFPPHGVVISEKNEYREKIKTAFPDFEGRIYDYRDAAINMMARPWPDYPIFKTVMLAWDNSPRFKQRASIFHNFSIEYYERWLARIMKQTIQRYAQEERIVFINAWNEWAEGTYLEPDQVYGHEYLLATHRAVRAAQSWEMIFDMIENTELSEDQRQMIQAGLLDYVENKETLEDLLVKHIQEKDEQLRGLPEKLMVLDETFKERDELLKQLEAMSQEITTLKNRLQEITIQNEQKDRLITERDKIISVVYGTRGWWPLSKLSRFQHRLEKELQEK